MSVHPKLNQYIRDVLHGVKPVLDKGEVQKVVMAIKNKVAIDSYNVFTLKRK